MDNDTIKDLGLCPICQKGHIMKGSLGYSCNYFKNTIAKSKNSRPKNKMCH